MESTAPVIALFIVLIPSTGQLDEPLGGVIVARKIIANHESLISHLKGSRLVLLQVVAESRMVEVTASIPFAVRPTVRKSHGRE